MTTAVLGLASYCEDSLNSFLSTSSAVALQPTEDGNIIFLAMCFRLRVLCMDLIFSFSAGV